MFIRPNSRGRSMGKGFLITATDTGVGKTFIGCCLMQAFSDMGLSVFPFKPVETGCEPEPQDALNLLKHASINLKLNEVCPYTFKEPLAPMVAERIEEKKIDISKIEKLYRNALKRFDIVMVEGAGGLLVPITGRFTYADLANLLNLPLIIVARSKLGTINHTLLTVRLAQAQGLKVMAVILNQYEGKDTAEKTNPEVINELSHIPVFRVPIMEEPAPLTEIAEFIHANL